jgi:co-chaperonin GroES (HSP10)
MKVLADNIVVVQGEKQTERKGILLPDSAQETSDRAEVVGVGPDVKDINVGDHILIPLMVKVRVSHTNACDMMFNDKPALVMKEEEVAVVWPREDVWSDEVKTEMAKIDFKGGKDTTAETKTPQGAA